MKISESTAASPCSEKTVSYARVQIALAWLTASVLLGYCSVSSYAALNCRGLYGDASHFLLKIAERESFHLFDRQRRTVEIL